MSSYFVLDFDTYLLTIFFFLATFQREAHLLLWLLSQEMESVIQLQILYETVCVNVLGKGITQSVPPLNICK